MKKTTTSTTVKYNWNVKNYSKIDFRFDKELVQKFKEKCQRENISMAEIVRNAIIDFLQED